jgi:alpha-glucosidase
MIETGREVLPVFVKAGAVIPMHLPGQHIDEIASDTLDLHVFAGNINTVQNWYEDDGTSHDHLNQAYCERTITHHGAEKRLVIDAQKGDYEVPYQKIRVYFHGALHAQPKIKTLSGTSGMETVQFVAPISNFDPFFTNTEHPWQHLNVPYLEFEYRTEAIEINY